jgi:hypothetical protein
MCAELLSITAPVRISSPVMSISMCMINRFQRR